MLGGNAWSCPFPPQADEAQINRAVAVIVVTVSPAGRATAVSVISDPGYGFGAAAARCAYGRRYAAARDVMGKAQSATTPPINVRFFR